MKLIDWIRKAKTDKANKLIRDHVKRKLPELDRVHTFYDGLASVLNEIMD